MMPDTTLSTLDQIRVKIRRLTKSPSAAQITDAQISDYVNTFVLYDFPEHLRTFNLRTTVEFFTQPYIDTYTGNDIVTNFFNIYTNVYENVYVAGYKQIFSQSREQFFKLYPRIEFQKSIGIGNGVTTNFTGTLTNIPALRDYVSFTSIGANNVGLRVYDVPNVPNDGTGTFLGDAAVPGTINYTTGAFNITFTSAPSVGQQVYSQTSPYKPTRPMAVLYYDSTFTFRPVPDQPYRVEFEVDIRPDELLQAGSMPALSQWWQYIAYGAAKKIFEDRSDMDSVQAIMPEFKKQEALVNRRLIDQQSKERVATVYTNMLEVLKHNF